MLFFKLDTPFSKPKLHVLNLCDLIGGQIDMAFINISGAIPNIESGRLRGLAVSTLKRSSLLPQLPAIAEVYAGYEVNSWYGLMAPAATPKAIVARLQTEVAQYLGVL